MPPKIPTSFVPHPQFTPQSARAQKSGRNLFLLGALTLLVLALIAVALTFAYEKYLESSRNAKEQTVQQEEQGIDQTTVAQFVALSNRLSAGNTILKNRVVSSQFFDLLEKITLPSVSIDTVTLTVADDRSATLTIAGTARDFNALANESGAFAQQTLIKHAIFSGLNADKNGTVAFTVAASVDPSLLLANGSVAPASGIISTTTAPVIVPVLQTGTTSAATTTP